MRKRRLFFALSACAVLAAAGSDIRAYADEGGRAENEPIHSTGSIVFREDGGAAIYAEDIRYLKEQIDALFAELPGKEETGS